MTIALSNVTGSAQTGLTTPGYNVTADTAPDASNGKQYVVSSLTGTQTNVRVHSASDPFLIRFSRPKSFRTLGNLLNAITGVYGVVPNNVYEVFTLKGVNIASGNIPRMFTRTARYSVPAGADAYDAVNIRAALSFSFGAETQVSAGWGDTLVSNVL